MGEKDTNKTSYENIDSVPCSFFTTSLIIRHPKVIFYLQFLQLMASAFILAKVLPSNIAKEITFKKKKETPTLLERFFKIRKAETMADYVFV